ncbi:XrtA/PEP-CTERM system TPR-repeat protein PrsT [Thioalkalivibrio sp. AKL12]|uniref:XrtA/PEP-CTERM system TPR-repeat protein PrsT n=1 Tax=Thioalkalivibrio sp. AKL12 TaxID=1158159 RepID=UPI001E4C0569|nr:XrtA/PEP-CTERM system TPR-repeat protein PrsT [Thioalkalivibrio sp. AKL12]
MVTTRYTTQGTGFSRPRHSRMPNGRLKPLALAVVLATGVGLAGCDPIGSASEQDYLERAQALQEQGDYRGARIEYRNALQLNTDAPATRRSLGKVYLELENPEEARRQLERAQSLGIPEAEVALPLAEAWFALDRFARIREQDVPEGLPVEERPRLHALRAVAFAAVGDRAAAEGELAQIEAGEQAPLQALAHAHLSMAEGAADQAIASLEKAIDLEPGLGHAWSLLGEYRRITGDADGAEEAFSRAIEVRPASGRDHMARAMVRLNQGDYEGARADVDGLKQGGSSHPGVHYLDGMLLMEQERYGEARASFEQAVAVNRAYSPALLGLGLAHRSLGNLEQAEHNLNRHVQESPGSLQGIRTLTAIYLEQDRVEDALQFVERVSREYTGDPADMAELRGRLLLVAGDSDAGIEALRDAAASSPGSQGLQELLAVALLRGGETEEGLDTLRAAGGGEATVQQVDTTMVLYLLQRGRYDEALERAQRLQESQPEAAGPLSLQGAALMGLGRIDEARAAFREGVALDPDDVSVAMNLAGLELQVGNRGAAREVLEGIQERHPGHARSAQRLASLSLQDGDQQGAARWFRVAIDAQPEMLPPHLALAQIQLQGGQPEQALETLQAAREHHPRNPDLLYALADVQQTLNRPDAAVASLAEAVEQAPDNVNLRLALARAHAQAGDEGATEATLRELLDQQPEHYRARVLLARGLLNQDRTEDARPHLQRLEERYEDRSEVQALLGRAALQREDPEAAVAHYRAALSDPGAQRRDWVHELARAQRDSGDVDAGQATLADWLDQNPQDLATRHVYAAQQMATGDPSGAVASYRRIVEQDADDVIALNNLAWSLRESETEEALGHARRAAELAPEAPPVLDTLAVVLIHAGEPAEAVDILERAGELAPDDPGIQYHLAWAESEQGDRGAARERLRRLLEAHEAFPQRADAEALLDRL